MNKNPSNPLSIAALLATTLAAGLTASHCLAQPDDDDTPAAEAPAPAPKPAPKPRPAARPKPVVIPLENDVPATERFVPVSLDGYANDNQELPIGLGQATVEGVPFKLVEKAGSNNWFLKAAGWSEWAQDPRTYIAAYDSVPPERTEQLPVINVPVSDYSAVYLLAYTEKGSEFSPVISFRIGSKSNKQNTVYVDSTPLGAKASIGRVSYHDFSGEVPRTTENATHDGKSQVIKTFDAAGKRYFLVRIPLGEALAQDFKERKAFDVEVTKEIRLVVSSPDANRYQYRPLGLPCGVHIFGMTFERSPIQMEVNGTASSNVFNEPEVPAFKISLRSNDGKPMPAASVEAIATDLYGNSTKIAGQRIATAPTATVDVAVKTQKRGWHSLEVILRDGTGKELLRRETTFALLAPDTRKYRNESPFGTWDFWGGHYTPFQADLLGPLYVKAGLRYGMFRATGDELTKYGVVKGIDPKSAGRTTVEKAITTRREEDPTWKEWKRFLVFHETSISGANIMRPPSVFSGREYKFSDAEQTKFQGLWDLAMKQCQEARAFEPGIEIYFGNGNVHLLEEFLKRKFPKELLGSRGNEAGSFMRMPETQPLDFVSNNSSLWMDRQVLDFYGYNDVPLRQCYEMGYPCTNPGNLSPETQAEYIVRHGMHSLAWGIPVIRFAEIADPGNSYYHSNWGAAGLCYGRPEVNPKPSYVAVATMTQALDGATFTRSISTASSAIYAFEFKGKDGAFTTVLWTLEGKRQVSLGGAGGAKVTDMMGNVAPVTNGDGGASIEISSAPIYVRTNAALTTVTPGAATYPDEPKADEKSFLISALDKISDWQEEKTTNSELENYDFFTPRRKGNFDYQDVAAFEGQDKAISVTPKLPVPGPVYYPMYSVLNHPTGVEIPGQPTGISVKVNGNGGWGRFIWELEDATGQRWISLGAEQKGEPNPWMADWMSKEEFAQLKSANLCDWNSDDCFQKSYINFDGWRTISFHLPGNYPGEGYHWPYNSQWRCQQKDGSRGDGVVHYPLRFKKLVVTLPEKVLHGKEYAPVPRRTIYMKELRATYRPVEEIRFGQ